MQDTAGRSEWKTAVVGKMDQIHQTCEIDGFEADIAQERVSKLLQREFFHQQHVDQRVRTQYVHCSWYGEV